MKNYWDKRDILDALYAVDDDGFSFGNVHPEYTDYITNLMIRDDKAKPIFGNYNRYSYYAECPTCHAYIVNPRKLEYGEEQVKVTATFCSHCGQRIGE